MNTEHYKNIRDAVEQSAKGEDPMAIEELALAITVGLWQFDGNHKENIIKLVREIADHSGEPIDVYNKADEHRDNNR